MAPSSEKWLQKWLQNQKSGSKGRVYIPSIPALSTCMIRTPYWLVRKVVVILAFFGGLRLKETLDLDLEKIESTPAGVFVTHQRCKQRTDKKDSKFLIPRAKKDGDVDYAGVMDSYLHEIKDCLSV